MPQFLCEIAEEIRAECPGELDPPSLDYAQVNVINIVQARTKVHIAPSSYDILSNWSFASSHSKVMLIFDFSHYKMSPRQLIYLLLIVASHAAVDCECVSAYSSFTMMHCIGGRMN